MKYQSVPQRGQALQLYSYSTAKQSIPHSIYHYIYTTVSNFRANTEYAKHIRSTKIIMMDEISMVTADMLETIDRSL